MISYFKDYAFVWNNLYRLTRTKCGFRLNIWECKISKETRRYLVNTQSDGSPRSVTWQVAGSPTKCGLPLPAPHLQQPGCLWTWASGNTKNAQYWRLWWTRRTTGIPQSPYAAHLAKSFRAVRREGKTQHFPSENSSCCDLLDFSGRMRSCQKKTIWQVFPK